MRIGKMKTYLCAVLGSVLLSGCGQDFKTFEAVTLNQSGSFELDMSPEYALPLFTAPGEKLWIPPWDPIILSGDGFEKGTIWITNNHGNTTYWYVSDYDLEAKHAQYVRVTPGGDSGTVDVSIVPNDDGGSVVTVTYQLTGLSTSGNESVEELLDTANYAKMMEDWRTMINDSRDKIDEHFSKPSMS